MKQETFSMMLIEALIDETIKKRVFASFPELKGKDDEPPSGEVMKKYAEEIRKHTLFKKIEKNGTSHGKLELKGFRAMLEKVVDNNLKELGDRLKKTFDIAFDN